MEILIVAGKIMLGLFAAGVIATIVGCLIFAGKGGAEDEDWEDELSEEDFQDIEDYKQAHKEQNHE